MYSSRGNPLSLVSVMHPWATLGGGVFSCHSNLVNHVRGSIRRVLPVDTEMEETKQPTAEAEGVNDRSSGNVA